MLSGTLKNIIAMFRLSPNKKQEKETFRWTLDGNMERVFLSYIFFVAIDTSFSSSLHSVFEG